MKQIVRLFVLRFVLVVILSGIVLFFSAIDEDLKPPPSSAALGPKVDKIPQGAYAAVMVSSSAFEYKYDSYEDNSWIVFLDRKANPIGYRHQKGMFRGQIGVTATGVVIADHKNFIGITKTGTTELKHSGSGMMSTASLEIGRPGENSGAFIWLDGGRNKSTGGYSSSGALLTKEGTLNPLELRGQVTNFGQCFGRAYVVFSTSSAERTQKEGYVLAEISLEKDQPVTREIAEWELPIFSFGNNLPLVCDGRDSVGLVLFNGIKTTREPLTSGAKFFQINTSSGEIKKRKLIWNKPSSDPYSAPFGAGTYWIAPDASTRYVNDRGAVFSLKVDGAAEGPLFTIAPDIGKRLLSVATNGGREGWAFVEWEEEGEYKRNNAVFVRVDFATGKEIDRIPIPKWLKDLTPTSFFSVTDIAILNPALS